MLVGEELYWGCSGIGTSILANRLGAGPVLIAGTDEQKETWLPPLLEEPILCSFGLSEPDAGSDVARMKTTAERRGDEYVLNGSKTFITNAGQAAWTVVFAKTDPSKGHRGISAFIVPMDAPGVTIEKHLDKMGQRVDRHVGVRATDVVVPAANRLGEEGDGFKIAMQTLDFTRPGTAAGAVGVAQAAYELAVEYAKERVTFDVPIAMHQGVNFLIADMATEIEAARLLTWQAAWLLDQGERATLHSSFAKRFAADTAMKVTTDAVQVFGGYGYIKEYPVEKLMRDAKLFQIYEGTSQIQRLVIAKEIFLPRGDEGRRHGSRDRSLRARRARHRRLARARAGRRADARSCRRRRRDRGHPGRVGALGGDRALGRARQAARAQGMVHTEETVEEIRALGPARARGAVRRHRPRAGRRGGRAGGGRARLRRHPRQQRGDARPRRAVPRPEPGALGARPARQPERRLQLRAGRLAAHEGARLGADREHGLGRRDARRLRPGELLDDEGRDPRADEDARDGGRPARDHVQRDRPGIIGTEAFHMANAAMNERIASRTVFRRPGEPQDIANAIAFLCSDLAAYITGVELYVSGGIELFVF